jgi:methyl-accepting chemotaxis protein
MADDSQVLVPAADLTNRQLLRAILAGVNHLGDSMSALDDAVADLKVAVDNIAGRLQTKVDALEQQLADGATDVSENITEIRADIDALNAVGVDTPQPPAE